MNSEWEQLSGHMGRLLELFATHCADRSTLDELLVMVGDESTWYKAHDLFSRIRAKTMDADDRGDEHAGWQYTFEEICAKTLYNLTDTDVPFDADAPYWVVPFALSLARRLNIDESEISRVIAE